MFVFSHEKFDRFMQVTLKIFFSLFFSVLVLNTIQLLVILKLSLDD